MKLESIDIEGLRKIQKTTVYFGDTTFIIGQNNVGKSTIFEAIRLILKKADICDEDFTMEFDEEKSCNQPIVENIIITATFAEVPDEANNWLGFKGRIYRQNETSKIKYRKTFSAKSTKYEMYQQKKKLNENYLDKSKITIKSIIEGGIEEEKVNAHFKEIPDTQNLLTKAYTSALESFHDVWIYEDEYDWIENPGGIPQNVLSKLPKLIIIPAEHKADELNSSKTSALGEVMTTIFEDVIEESDNYDKVKEYFGELAKEIDTDREDTEFGKLMIEVNKTIKNIFPDSQIYAKVNLSDPSTFLNPNYEIKLGSNILTKVKYQGTGMIRSTAFSLLRFREDWKKKREKDIRNLIICFEEPELFLHPSAANQMRDTIYELASNENQIICTSHSPYMIDLSREKQNQIIDSLILDEGGYVVSLSINVTEEFYNLMTEERHYVKLLLKLDDYLARVFFCKKIIIIEGDTEDILFRRTIDLLPKETRALILSEVQIIKARGKATIAPLITYLKALGITDIFVIHDLDKGKESAEMFNPIILKALDNDESKRCVLENCVEDILGYPEPSKDKPYKAYKHTESWTDYSNIDENWKNIFKESLKYYLVNA